MKKIGEIKYNRSDFSTHTHTHTHFDRTACIWAHTISRSFRIYWHKHFDLRKTTNFYHVYLHIKIWYESGRAWRHSECLYITACQQSYRLAFFTITKTSLPQFNRKQGNDMLPKDASVTVFLWGTLCDESSDISGNTFARFWPVPVTREAS